MPANILSVKSSANENRETTFVQYDRPSRKRSFGSLELAMMHPAYFETHFRTPDFGVEWPQAFAIVSAYATTGERWPLKRNLAADRELET